MKRFIIVDDDHLNNFISRMNLKKAFGNTEVMSFEDPSQALNYIKEQYTDAPYMPTVLFLDINMPELSGWEFVNELEKLNIPLKGQFSIYILSSSIDSKDKERAEGHELITGFLSKPLSHATLGTIIIPKQQMKAVERL